MSRLTKKPIVIPENTKVSFDGFFLEVKGPKGKLKRLFKNDVVITVGEIDITITKTKDTIFSKALLGTYASHIRNMIQGVNRPYVKKLIIEGVGFKVELSGSVIKMALGFSHPVEIKVPEGIDVVVEKNTIQISGIDKELVGSFAAEIRSKKKPEPYKGKGIRYEDEEIRRKQGKKTV